MEKTMILSLPLAF